MGFLDTMKSAIYIVLFSYVTLSYRQSSSTIVSSIIYLYDW